jgi:arabinose-5-phosphate isomerase
MSSTTPHTAEAAFLAEALRAEADAITRIADRMNNGDHATACAAVDLLAACTGHVVVAGMGKSGLVGSKISATFCSLGQPSNVLHPAEAVHGDLGRVRRGDVVMLLSYSGETEEVVNLAAILKADGVPRLGISCSDGSTLARMCDVHLSLGDVTEACPLNLAPTASTTAMLALGDALALAVSRRRNFREDDFHKHHPGGLLGVGLRKVTEILRFRVGDNLTVVRDDVTIREACVQAGAAANHRRAGAILLVDTSGRLSGIFTDGDLRRLIVNDVNAMERPIREVMTARPQHLMVDDLVRDAVRLVRERRVDEIPVLDGDGRPIGLVDVQDLIALKVVSE